MHLNGLGKTDRLTGEPFNPGPQGQMFSLDLLRVTLARLVLLCLDMSRIRAPRVCIIAGDAHSVSDLNLRFYWRYPPGKSPGERENHSKLKRNTHVFYYFIKALQ